MSNKSILFFSPAHTTNTVEERNQKPDQKHFFKRRKREEKEKRRRVFKFHRSLLVDENDDCGASKTPTEVDCVSSVTDEARVPRQFEDVD